MNTERPMEHDLLFDFLRVVEAAAIASARHLATIRRVCASADGLHNQTVRLLEALAERLYAASARPLRAKKLRAPAKRRQR